MTELEKEELRCDLLLFLAIPTEERKLREVAKQVGLRCEKRTVLQLGDYYHMGTIGQTKVNAVVTKMGPFSHGGSASRAINFRIASGATGIIQLGMAFGVDPTLQSHGDVVVSTSLIPYDLREVRPRDTVSEAFPLDHLNPLGDTQEELPAPARNAEIPGSVGSFPPQDRPYYVDYKHAIRHRSKESLLNMFLSERDRGNHSHGVQFGGILSGGARIFSRRFLGEIMRGVPSAEDGIIGGEMEGVGLLSVSPMDDPIWIIVKGISDFADEHRDEVIRRTRPIACENSVRFVLGAVANA